MMDWGVAINLRETVAEIVEKAIIADRGGIDTIWLTDYPATRLSPVLASAVAQKTKRCRIGIGLLSPLIYPPSQILRFLSSLINLYGNRFDLLIGPGDKVRLATIGVDYGNISTLVKRIVEAVNRIREGLPKKGECKLFVGAQGPKMIAASSHADGVLLNYADPKMIEWAKNLVPHHLKDFNIGIFPPTLIRKSIICKKDLGIRTSAAVVALGLNRSIMKRFDLLDALMPSIALMKQRKSIDEDTVNQIEQKVLDRFCICGQKEALIKYLRSLSDLSIDLIVFGPPQGASVSGVRELVESKEFWSKFETH